MQGQLKWLFIDGLTLANIVAKHLIKMYSLAWPDPISVQGLIDYRL